MTKVHLYKNKAEKRKDKQYEISWHNLIVADSISEALQQVRAILEDLEKLLKLEKENKIEAECGSDSPSFQIITVLNNSIEPELQKIGIVSCYEMEVDETETPNEESNGALEEE
jgi:hypothetical protein